jgi:hypothetical protein
MLSCLDQLFQCSLGSGYLCIPCTGFSSGHIVFKSSPAVAELFADMQLQNTRCPMARKYPQAEMQLLLFWYQGVSISQFHSVVNIKKCVITRDCRMVHIITNFPLVYEITIYFMK